MYKTLIAAVSVATIAGGALAQSSVTLYGVVDAYVESARVPGKGSNLRVSNGGTAASRWGLRGSEELGGGLRAAFALENGFASDSGAALQGGRFFGRQAFVSLQSTSAGEVRLGRQLTPLHYSMQSTDIDAFAPFSPVFAMYVSNFDQSRNDNQLSYWTPHIAGLTGAVSIAPGEDAVVAPSAGTPWIPVAGTMKRNVGALLRYRQGALDTSVAFHQGGQKAATGEAEQRSWNAGAHYKGSAVHVGANLWTHRNELPNGFAPQTRGAAVGVRVPATPALSFIAQLGRVNDNGLVYTTGAAKAKGHTTYLNVGADYALSKRTGIYLRYAHVKDDNGGFNGRPAAALFGLFGPGNALPTGGTASTLALGLRHSF